MRRLLIALRVFLTFALLLGLIYPLLLVVLGQIIFPFQANGSLLISHGKVIGSALIAQEFTLPQYFHSRFSAINYDATNSGGSNLALSHTKLYQQITQHLQAVTTKNNLASSISIPADMVLNSASGLDPHISLANAMLQLPRVAKARNLSTATIKKLVYEALDHDFVGIWGQRGVNVLRLNLALDQLENP